MSAVYLASPVSFSGRSRRGTERPIYDVAMVAPYCCAAGCFAAAWIDAMILPPPWIENRLVGGVPLEAHTHAQSQSLYHVPVDFDPQCNIALWEMLDTYPEANGDGVRWRTKLTAGSGMPCDASQGAFAGAGNEE